MVMKAHKLKLGYGPNDRPSGLSRLGKLDQKAEDEAKAQSEAEFYAARQRIATFLGGKIVRLGTLVAFYDVLTAEQKVSVIDLAQSEGTDAVTV